MDATNLSGGGCLQLAYWLLERLPVEDRDGLEAALRRMHDEGAPFEALRFAVEDVRERAGIGDDFVREADTDINGGN